MLERFCISICALLLSATTMHAQWLPAERQAKEKAIWEASGVPWIAGLQFYELPKVSQKLVSVGGRAAIDDKFGIFDDRYRGLDGNSDNVNALFPWVVPSGLHDSPKSQWRKVGSAYFPDKILVYRERIMVQNSVRKPGGGFYEQPQTRLTWRFPDHTIFAELLIRTHQGREWAFEIRKYEIIGGKMRNAVTYRPDVQSLGSLSKTVDPGKLSDFGFRAATFTVNLTGATGPQKLKETREIITATGDDGVVPRGFLGSMRTCVDCHEQAGKPTSYGATTIRGGGSAISWHPFTMRGVNTDAMPTLDRRWPLDVR